MNKYVVIYNSLEVMSRDFIAGLSNDIEKIDWYSRADKEKVVEYISKDMPQLCDFPSMVDTENKLIILKPENYGAGVEALEALLEAIQINRSNLKYNRDCLLTSCDWILLSDSQATEECKAAFIEYRQALRDIDFTAEVVNFPTRPSYQKVE